MSGCRTGARRSIFSAAALCCCASAADAPAGEGLQRAAAERGVPLEIVALDVPEVLAAYERRLVLVRPDGHVAWRADAEPQDARTIIDRVRGAHARGRCALGP